MQSISNNEIKHIKSLSQKKFRNKEGLFIVEGEKLVEEACKSSFEVVSIYRKVDIGEAAMSRISQMSTTSPVLAVVRIPHNGRDGACDPAVRTLGLCDFPANGLFLALDNISDPGNLGTIIRVADWFGITDIFATQDTVEVYNPKVVQATMGAIFRVRIHYCDLVSTLWEFAKAGGTIYGTFLDGDNIYDKSLHTGADSPVMVVIGNESGGISSAVSPTIKERLLVPSYPPLRQGSESLNAATATAIILSEFRRRM